jgi:hypothetical protein
VIDRLARDLRNAFPDMKGLSSRNLKYMRSFAEAYPEPAIVQQVVAQIPWGHNIILIDKAKDPSARLWYAQQTITHGCPQSRIPYAAITPGLVDLGCHLAYDAFVARPHGVFGFHVVGEDEGEVLA